VRENRSIGAFGHGGLSAFGYLSSASALGLRSLAYFSVLYFETGRKNQVFRNAVPRMDVLSQRLRMRRGSGRRLRSKHGYHGYLVDRHQPCIAFKKWVGGEMFQRHKSPHRHSTKRADLSFVSSSLPPLFQDYHDSSRLKTDSVSTGFTNGPNYMNCLNPPLINN